MLYSNQKMKKQTKDNFKEGMSFAEISIVVVIIGLIASFSIPNFLMQQDLVKAEQARSHLRTVYDAQKEYASDHNGAYLAGTLTQAFADTNDFIIDAPSFQYYENFILYNAATADTGGTPYLAKTQAKDVSHTLYLYDDGTVCCYPVTSSKCVKMNIHFGGCTYSAPQSGALTQRPARGCGGSC